MTRRRISVVDGIKYIDDSELLDVPEALTFDENDTTPSVAGGKVFITNNTSGTSITDFDDSLGDGHCITIFINDNNTSLIHSDGVLELEASQSIMMKKGDVFKAISIDGVWYGYVVRTA